MPPECVPGFPWEMGGVKNKEQKKKAQHVYSSGGGSGGKGPALIDKRNQELPCPHCDRTFKQVCSPSRHILQRVTLASSCPAQRVFEPGWRAGAALPRAPREQAPRGGARGGSRRRGGAGRPRCGACAPAAPAAGTLGPAMTQAAVSCRLRSDAQCGAQGAFVAGKTPKMLLADWCQQQKRPKPRFRVNANPAAPGSFVAKARSSSHCPPASPAHCHVAGVKLIILMTFQGQLIACCKRGVPLLFMRAACSTPLTGAAYMAKYACLPCAFRSLSMQHLPLFFQCNFCRE